MAWGQLQIYRKHLAVFRVQWESNLTSGDRKCCAFHVRRAVIELAVAAVASFNLSSSMTAPALPGKPWDDMAVTLQQEQEQQMHILHAALCLQTRDDRTCPITEGAMT